MSNIPKMGQVPTPVYPQRKIHNGTLVFPSKKIFLCNAILLDKKMVVIQNKQKVRCPIFRQIHFCTDMWNQATDTWPAMDNGKPFGFGIP